MRRLIALMCVLSGFVAAVLFSLKPPKVSIIITSYNSEPFLSACLSSLSRQTFSDFEVIFINDGSTDRSPQIAELFAKKDNRFRVFHIKNQGVASARSHALQLARGKYVWFVDADDWIADNALELLVPRAEADRLDMLSFQALTYYEHSRQFGKEPFYHFFWRPYNGNLPQVFSYWDIKPYLTPYIATSMTLTFYRRDFLKQKHVDFIDGLFFEDNFFFTAAFYQADRIGLLDREIYFRRRHAASTMSNAAKYIDDYIEINRLTLGRLAGLNLPPAYLKVNASQSLKNVSAHLKNTSLQKRKKLAPLLNRYLSFLKTLPDNVRPPSEALSDFQKFLK